MTKKSVLTCQNERRRYRVREHEHFDGLDYVEVVSPHVLRVYFLGKAPPGLARENVRIRGGRRIRNIHVTGFRLCTPEEAYLDDCMVITVDKPGDFSTYNLCVVALGEDGKPTGEPFPGFDPRYACVDFTFRIDCPSDLDCKQPRICPPEERDEPEISYLAKDYASFRQLILDRLALIMPEWQERHVPDLGIALVELLAYTGDHLSYYQDAVATEAYLDTARQRVSVRRHARLVDYAMHEGCNARAWVHIEAGDDQELDPVKTAFITAYNDAFPFSGRVLTWEDLDGIPSSQYEVFEPLLLPRYEFLPGDVKDLAGLAVGLRLLSAGNDSAGPLSHEAQRAILEELNRLLLDVGLYARAPFGEVAQTPRFREWIEQNPQGRDLVRLNRLLVETSFPAQVRSSERIYLYAAHNRIEFHTWGDRECCLPRGATSATLRDEWIIDQEQEPETGDQEQETQQQAPPKEEPPGPPPQRRRKLALRAGDYVLFEEVIGPETGNPADADPARRHVVRLTRVQAGEDKLLDQPVLEIEWAEADALPFPLCISAVGPPPDCTLLANVSVARGNVLMADHGRRYEGELLGGVPQATTEIECLAEGQASEPQTVPGRFRPRLARIPLTFHQPLADDAAATTLLQQDPRRALPWIWLAGGDETATATVWRPRRDLLASHAGDAHFVVEVDNEGRAHLRFGDGELGAQPRAGMKFRATYRVGNGPAGNVGAEAISHLVYADLLSGIDLKPRNPLPAAGGTGPEPLEEVKLFAPHAFRTELQRAIIADDYAHIVMRDFADKVQRAAATLRWTGSWPEVLVAVDVRGDTEADPALLAEIEGHLYRFRRIGHDLVVRAACSVPLDVELTVCVLPHFLRGHVRAALLDRFSNRRLPDGTLGFFHPDKLTFGQGVRLSALVAAARAVPGVENVVVTKLNRLYESPRGELADGILPLGPLEIARLDNDASFPENGRFKLVMGGGR